MTEIDLSGKDDLDYQLIFSVLNNDEKDVFLLRFVYMQKIIKGCRNSYFTYR
jgi:hypothetical protein